MLEKEKFPRFSPLKVHGIGEMYGPKNVTLQEDQRYQNVRIIAVYDTDQIPALQG
jgi:hypothetical protein